MTELIGFLVGLLSGAVIMNLYLKRGKAAKQINTKSGSGGEPKDIPNQL